MYTQLAFLSSCGLAACRRPGGLDLSGLAARLAARLAAWRRGSRRPPRPGGLAAWRRAWRPGSARCVYTHGRRRGSACAHALRRKSRLCLDLRRWGRGTLGPQVPGASMPHIPTPPMAPDPKRPTTSCSRVCGSYPLCALEGTELRVKRKLSQTYVVSPWKCFSSWKTFDLNSSLGIGVPPLTPRFGGVHMPGANMNLRSTPELL